MNAQEFFQLADKVAKQRATHAEEQALAAIIKEHPALAGDLEEMKRAAGWKEGKPLPRQIFIPDDDDPRQPWEEEDPDEPQEVREAYAGNKPAWRNWRWWFRLTIALGICAFFLWPDFDSKPPPSVVQIGVVQGTNTTISALSQELNLFQSLWPGTVINTASTAEDIQKWEADWPEVAPQRSLIKLVYDRSTGEIRLRGLHEGREFARIFPLDNGLAEGLKLCNEYIIEQLR